jgi:hypothetical protein
MKSLKRSRRTPLETGVTAWILVAVGLFSAPAAGAQPDADPWADGRIEMVALPADSPLVSIRVMVRAGSIYDPPGKEGLSALTALLLGASGRQTFLRRAGGRVLSNGGQHRGRDGTRSDGVHGADPS